MDSGNVKNPSPDFPELKFILALDAEIFHHIIRNMKSALVSWASFK